MADRCPIPTPDEQIGLEIEAKVRRTMLAKVYAALEEAAAESAASFEESGLKGPAPAYEYFASVLHQQMYCVICGADPQTFAGGKAETAKVVIRNAQNIARHYWGVDIEP